MFWKNKNSLCILLHVPGLLPETVHVFILLSNKLNKETKDRKGRAYNPSNSRASDTSLCSGRTDTILLDLCSCTYSVCINGTACTNNACGIRPNSVQENRNNSGIAIVSALGHLLTASWEEVTLLQHRRFPNLHQNSQLEGKKMLSGGKSGFGPAEKEFFSFSFIFMCLSSNTHGQV